MSNETQIQRRSLLVYLAPLAFFALAGLFAFMLAQNDRNTSLLPSVFIGRDAPVTPLPEVPGLMRDDGIQTPGLDPVLFEGNITLLNVWASWCVPCRQEHPYLIKLAGDPRVQLVGLNYKDKTENAVQFLNDLGNPYDAVGADLNGRAGIDWGVYGVPETFLVGPDGVIRYKFTGPINDAAIESKFLPEIDKLAAQKN